ncbi:hypothetical protein FRB96_006064 [Tulasnella sp. 330]|nr:hypothetical protein FRB96_006064 [Tulasnella sp. 330]KAG8878242.1 hypothetical protein FRB98_006308 [Tulasnella sp. 332]
MLQCIQSSLKDILNDPNNLTWVSGALVPLVIGILYLKFNAAPQRPRAITRPTVSQPGGTRTTIMSPPKADLAPPRSDPFTLQELKRYDGTDASLPIYVSIKGTIFDVTSKRDVYGPPTGSYRVFAGKDASKAFGLSSLKEEDADPDWSTLEPKYLKTLNEWYTFFRKRYNVVGRVVDMPEPVRHLVWPTATESDDLTEVTAVI